MELTVVLVLLMISAGLLAPSIGSLINSRAEQDFVAKWERFLVNERNQARAEKKTRTVRFDEAAKAFREADDANAFTALPDNATISASRTDGVEVAADDWTVKFFADGTASVSEITVSIDSKPWSLEVTNQGLISLRQRELAPLETPDWEAGNNETRG
jgi:type II secretory pathway pseudopilin PulG